MRECSTPAMRSPTRAIRSSTATTAAADCKWGETVRKATNTIKDVDSVIAGHITGPNALQRWQDFVDFGEFNRLYAAHARASLKAGKTPEQAMAEFKLSEKFKDYTLTGGRGGTAGNFPRIYEEIKTAGK